MAIVKRGKKYHVIWRDPSGKQRSRSAGSLKRDAERMLTEINHDMMTGQYVDVKPIVFRDFVALWLSRQKPNVKRSSYLKYESVINTELMPRFGDLKLATLDVGRIQDWITRLSTRDLSASTINTYYAVLRKMLEDAVKYDYIYRNPAAKVDRPKIPKSEIIYLKPKEIGRLLRAVEDRPLDHAILFLLAMTGLRIGEALALTWSDIDLVTQTIAVNKTTHAGEVSSPKTSGSNRNVRFPEVLKTELMTFTLSQSISPGDHVFSTRNGTALDRNHVRNRILAPALKKAGLKHVSVHSLRHSYATIMIDHGENLKFIQNQLGHSSMRVTFDRYGHLLPAAGDEAMKRLDRMVDDEFC